MVEFMFWLHGNADKIFLKPKGHINVSIRLLVLDPVELLF